MRALMWINAFVAFFATVLAVGGHQYAERRLLVPGNDQTVRNFNGVFVTFMHRRIAEGRPLKWLAWL